MTFTRLSGALLAVILLLAVTGTASATSSSPSKLTLTVGAPNGPTITVKLHCAPPGGSHPQPKPACAELVAAEGDFDALGGNQELMACTMEYRPVVASARGNWEGHPVYWKHKYSNNCTKLSATGTVFDF